MCLCHLLVYVFGTHLNRFVGEETLGKWFAQTGRRSEIFLATKFGSRDLTPGAANPDVPNSKPSYIKRQIENSLKALQTDWIDLYYQHRVDPEVPIEGTCCYAYALHISEPCL